MARNGDGYAIAPTTAARSWWGVVAETFFASLFFNTATNVAAMMTPSVPPLQAPPPPQTTQTPMARASRTRAAASMAGLSAAERQWLLSRCPGWPRLVSRIGRRLECSSGRDDADDDGEGRDGGENHSEDAGGNAAGGK